MESVINFKFLDKAISEDLFWAQHFDAISKKAHHCLCPWKIEEIRQVTEYFIEPRVYWGMLTDCSQFGLVIQMPKNKGGGRKWWTLDHPPSKGSTVCPATKRWRVIKCLHVPGHALISLLSSGRRWRSLRTLTIQLLKLHNHNHNLHSVTIYCGFCIDLLGQAQARGTSIGGTSWWMWACWAEGPLSTLYDYCIILFSLNIIVWSLNIIDNLLY